MNATFCLRYLRGRLWILLAVLSALSAVGQAKEGTKTYTQVEWTDLIPKEDLDALLNPPEDLLEIADGSEQDQLSGQWQADKVPTADSRYQQALVSTNIRPEFHNTQVRIPGFIVPLEFDETLKITEFFIVPYFGACIHTPPPPPNQIIYARFKKGLHLESLMDPFWIEGTLLTQVQSNELATSAYSMQVSNTERYTE